METGVDKPQPRARHLSIGQLIAFAVVLGVIALFAAGLQIRTAQPVERGAAPQFTLQLFDGGTLSLADLRGKVVVVNFWASWCQPCRLEAPVLEQVWRKYKDRGVVFVGVDYVDTEADARAYMKEFDLTYPNGPDIGTEISRQYHIQGVPETYFIGKDGQLYGNHIGPISEPILTAKIEELLRK
jgi:cytochrome c biogenesis protein CcmG/thiol:disulfide interchange protein DsbE